MTPSLHGPIGLFDSGLGGLTVLRELQRALPQESYVYLGDNARNPYGTKGSDTIVRYSRDCARFLMNEGIKVLVIACNTASAAALEVLEAEMPVPVIGTIHPATRVAISVTRNRRIAVLGTNATIASQVYERAIHQAAPDVTVVPQACPLFVPLVESGMVEGEIVHKIAQLYLEPIRAAEADTVILGCTHYPLLREVIQEVLGPEVTVVECSKAIAQDVAEVLDGALPEGRISTARYYVTDEVSRFNYLATALLGGGSVEAVRIESLS